MCCAYCILEALRCIALRGHDKASLEIERPRMNKLMGNTSIFYLPSFYLLHFLFFDDILTSNRGSTIVSK
jgi:hypothetical protein